MRSGQSGRVRGDRTEEVSLSWKVEGEDDRASEVSRSSRRGVVAVGGWVPGR